MAVASLEETKEQDIMRKLFIGLGALVVPAVIAGFTVTGCDDSGTDALSGVSEDVCGPCGTVAMGDIGISGNAKLDGFFKAVADLNNANVAINTDFYANVAELEKAFGVEVAADATIDARVTALVAAIKGEVSANVEGSMKVNYVPAQCSASLSVAVDAQAKCEVKGGCEAKVDPGSVEVTCEGSCSGSCSGECSGTVSCQAEAPSISCEGKCEGKCAVEVTAACNGTCKGTCDGECSVRDAQGNCNGTCSGSCTGTCETDVKGECSGTCSGSCTTTGGSAECKGNVKCEGTCEASCSGGCEGKATPPEVAVDCDASAECKAQASAQASANLECTPPQLSVGYEFSASANATAQAEFKAKMEVLKVKGAAILAGFAKYEALITGKIDGKVVFETSPLANVTAELNGVVKAGVKGSLFADIPTGRITCVIPAMEASVKALGALTTESAATLKAQGSFATAFTGGFK
jgi:hypothetical protein